MQEPLRRDGTDWVLDVRVQPRASRTEFAGLFGDRLRVRLNAPPVDGRANSALLAFIATACDLPVSRVSLDAGRAGRDKRVRLHDLERIPAALQSALSRARAG
ncbi:MAG: DUF167 family protein [Gammaproteobacteria bacterium]|jgi:uncharacterized protein (TIGR00251 family)|nr:DUF167 family protein [Gammaproteobacteria bacterium]